MTSRFSSTCVGLVLAGLLGAYFPSLPAEAAQARSPDADLAYQLALEAGRLDAMVARSEDTADMILANQMPKEPANLREYDEETIRTLKMAILRYNLLVEGACAADRPNKEFCGEPYFPDWLRAPSSTVYSRAQMQTMISDTRAKISPLWDTVCARGRTQARDPRYCDLE